MSIKDGYLQVSKGSPCTLFIIKIDYIPWLYLTYQTSIDFKGEESVFATDWGQTFGGRLGFFFIFLFFFFGGGAF